LPEHLSHIAIPPAWQNVIVNPDSDGELLAVGYVWKANGGVARQSIYSKDHNEKALKEQIKMVDNLNKQYGKITNQINNSLKNGDLLEKENAFITKLVDHTSIRIGSSEEALGAKKAYGASTLEARHIVPQKDGTVMLEFVGKKGVDNKFPVTDKKLASTLLKLKKGADQNARIFKTDYSGVLNYMKSLDGGEFTIKDLRTKFACDKAIEKINSMPVPTNPKEYKKAVKEVTTYVSGLLNNTPSMAFKSYIMPTVWLKWKKKAGVKE
jgi:DNA topoisomerase I